MNRETWLEKATNLLRPYFKEKGYELPDVVRVSCGWPSSRALSTKKRRLGECWHAAASSDGIKQVFVSPYVSDSMEVLGVLVHELLHAALPDKTGHKGPFKKGCIALGLDGPATCTKPDAALTRDLSALLGEEEQEKYDLLPPYPQGKLDKLDEAVKDKQTTRMRKLVCIMNDDHPEDDIILRASKKALEKGTPMCFCGKEFEIEEPEENA